MTREKKDLQIVVCKILKYFKQICIIFSYAPMQNDYR